jgi:hypothetical protein
MNSVDVKFACALIASLLACGKDEPRGSARSDTTQSAAQQTDCPSSNVVLATWPRVNAAHAPITLRLPQNVEVVQTRPQADRGETWRIGALTVFYRVTREPIDSLEASSSWESYSSCTEMIGGRSARLTMGFSRATTVPGQVVIATWRLSEDAQILFYAHGPSRQARDTLLAVVRSVEFGS